MLCNDGLEKGHESHVPVVDNTRDVDVALDHLGMAGDEVAREDGAQRVGHQDYPGDVEMSEQAEDELVEVVAGPVVGASAFVLAVESGDGEVDPPVLSLSLGLQSCPLDVVAWSSVEGQDSMFLMLLAVGDVLLTVGDVAEPSVAELHFYFISGLVFDFSDGSHLYFQGFEVVADDAFDLLVLMLDLGGRTGVYYVGVGCLGVEGGRLLLHVLAKY